MDDEPSVRVRIPHGEDLDDLAPDVWCVLVPGPLVEYAIDTLQAVLALWKAEESNEPDDDKWGPLLAAAGYVLGGLLRAQATRNSKEGVRRLVGQIARSWGSSIDQQLEALCGDVETDYIVEALLALHQEAERRHTERIQQREESRRKQRQQQAAAGDPAPAGRGPTAERDPGWEF